MADTDHVKAVPLYGSLSRDLDAGDFFQRSSLRRVISSRVSAWCSTWPAVQGYLDDI